MGWVSENSASKPAAYNPNPQRMSNPYSSPEQQNGFAPSATHAAAVRIMQIIVFALVMGVVSFLGVALVVKQGAFDGEPEILSWLALGIAGVMFVVHLFIPGIAASTALRQINSEDIRSAEADRRFELIAPIFQTRLILACALLEGAAVLNLVAYIVEPYVGNVIVAAVLAAMIAGKIPTASKVEFWVQDRAREIEMR